MPWNSIVIPRFWLLKMLVAGLAVAATAHGAAKPVEVKATSSGTPGHWKLSFSVKNNLKPGPRDMAIIVFGLQLPQGSVTEPQAGFEGYAQSWSHYFPAEGGGGRQIEFGHSWTSSTGKINPSELRKGFEVQVPALDLPAKVPWFVLARSASGGQYVGKDNYGSPTEPIFAGELLLNAAPVPEPGTSGLVGLGLACLAVCRHRAASKPLASADAH